jgi:hypothetical protein
MSKGRPLGRPFSFGQAADIGGAQLEPVERQRSKFTTEKGGGRP